jgi:hypothetical protein
MVADSLIDNAVRKTLMLDAFNSQCSWQPNSYSISEGEDHALQSSSLADELSGERQTIARAWLDHKRTLAGAAHSLPGDQQQSTRHAFEIAKHAHDRMAWSRKRQPERNHHTCLLRQPIFRPC